MPRTKNEREKNARNIIRRNFGAENSFSPNLLLSMFTKEQVVPKRIIQTRILRRERGSGPR